MILGDAYVISLARHEERLATFRRDYSRLVEVGFSREPKVVYGIDGKRTGCPAGWIYRETAGDAGFYRGLGAWGCYRSHLGILEALLNARRFAPVLILEDDAFPVADFDAIAKPFFRSCPDDWDSLYLGGEHLATPIVEHADYVRCIRASRSHAYVIRGEAFMRRLYEKLADWRAWPNNFYADHAMSDLQLDGRWNVYAPAAWLFGQRGGYSDCTNQTVPDRVWQ